MSVPPDDFHVVHGEFGDELEPDDLERDDESLALDVDGPLPDVD